MVIVRVNGSGPELSIDFFTHMSDTWAGDTCRLDLPGTHNWNDYVWSFLHRLLLPRLPFFYPPS